MSTPSSPTAKEPQGYLRLVIAMVAIYALLFILAQMHRMGGAVVAPYLKLELGLSTSELGLAIGVMFLASGAAQPVSGVLLDRFGAVRSVVYLAPLAFVGTLLFAWSETVLGLVVGRAMIGIGQACIVSGLYIFLLSWVRRENYTMAASVVLAVPGTIAVILASTPLALALDVWGRAPVFSAFAIASVAVMAVVVLAVREGPRSNRAERQPETLGRSIAGIGLILSRKRFLWIAAYGITALGPSYAIIGLLSGVYLRARFQLDTAALGNAIFGLLIALNLGGVIYGPLDRLVGRRKWVVGGGVCTQIALICVLASLPSLGFWPTLCLLIAFAGVSQLQPLIISHAQSLFGPELAGRVITTSNIFMVGSISLFQFGAGAAYDWFVDDWGVSVVDSYRLTFLCLVGCQAIGLMFYLKAPPPER